MTVNVFLYAETVINGRDSNRIMLSTYELLIILALVLLFFGKGFYALLEYAGVFVAVLLGILPICMAWSARYYKKYSTIV